jgi:hypothetical protein
MERFGQVGLDEQGMWHACAYKKWVKSFNAELQRTENTLGTTSTGKGRSKKRVVRV